MGRGGLTADHFSRSGNQYRHVLHGAPAQTDVDKGSDDHAYHVFQETGASDIDMDKFIIRGNINTENVLILFNMGLPPFKEFKNL